MTAKGYANFSADDDKAWKDAVIDACVVAWVPVLETASPREVLQALLREEQRIALDPTVSEEAFKLMNTYQEKYDKLYQESCLAEEDAREADRDLADLRQQVAELRAEVARLGEAVCAGCLSTSGLPELHTCENGWIQDDRDAWKARAEKAEARCAALEKAFL